MSFPTTIVNAANRTFGDDSSCGTLGWGGLDTSRTMFQNPRGTTCRYCLVYDTTNDIHRYYYSADGLAWIDGGLCLATDEVCYVGMDFYDDGAQLCVVVAGIKLVGANFTLFYRQGTIADAAQPIAWLAGEQTYIFGTVDSGADITDGDLVVDRLGYVYYTAVVDYQGDTFYLCHSTNILPNALIFSDEIIEHLYSVVNYIEGLAKMPAGTTGQVAICYYHGAFYTRNWIIWSWDGANLTEEATHSQAGVGSHLRGSGSRGSVVDDNGDFHVLFKHAYTTPTDLLCETWDGNVTVSETTVQASLVNNGSTSSLAIDRILNYLHVYYLSAATPYVLYKKHTPTAVISWTGVYTIETYPGAATGTGVCGNAELNLSTPMCYYDRSASPAVIRWWEYVAPGAIFKPLSRGHPWHARGERVFRDSDIFTIQDENRWYYYQISTGLPEDTGFLWSGNGQVTIPADHRMYWSQGTLYGVMTTRVRSADMSDCRIGFYVNGFNYCWLDQDLFRIRTGANAERTIDVSAHLPNNTWLILQIIWTPDFCRLKVDGKTVATFHEPMVRMADCRYEVIAGGSILLSEWFSINEMDTPSSLLDYAQLESINRRIDLA